MIFEIKSFARVRLTASQRREVERSLKRAVKHNPVRWILILPLDHSPSEERWFDRLKEQNRGIELEWWGLTWLNLSFAPRDDLRRLVESEDYELLRRAHEVDIEGRVPANLTASVGRLNVLMNRTQELSPYWRADFSTAPDGITVTYNERFPGAADLDPVQLRAIFRFPTSDGRAAAAERRLKDALDYGGDIEVDGRYVENFEIMSSLASRAMFEAPGPLERFALSSLDSPKDRGFTLQMAVVATTGEVKYRLPMQVDQHTAGVRGVRIRARDATESLEAELKVDRKDQGGRLSARITWRGVTGKFPYKIRPGFEIFTRVERDDHIELRIDNQSVARHHAGTARFLVEARLCADMIVALEKLQDHCKQTFPIPDDITWKDAHDIIAAAQVLSGQSIRTGRTGIELSIKPGHVASFLKTARPLGITHLRGEMIYGITCGGHQMNIGRVFITTPRVRLTNLAELEAIADIASEPVARYVCVDDDSIDMQLVAPN
ncbi:hypothetical protein FraEuI1c_0896 [Pseudofrankia inefficax]|uniref:Uncharacterized protein n=1 Tax=Pseudofrankia inefficax (strain DSM 45817 / CECT 9037 / DDB 130130 / EuI1c) TaxID=298654 RepID=E3IXF4_PSEI1|nr:hypothetical protein FraEuI1c_0896 [Pseudofrankia inefficax]